MSKETVVHRKLVRDKIPELIRERGSEPLIRQLEEKSFRDAVGMKILEEASELFSQLRQENPQGVLEESADLLEISLTALQIHGFGMEDLERARDERNRIRGGFRDRCFLESIGTPVVRIEGGDAPTLFFAPDQNADLINLITQELGRSEEAWIASAFFTPGVLNLFLSAFERFLAEGGGLKVLLSTMGNVTRPEYLHHLKNEVPRALLKVFHPHDLPFDQTPPEFHAKAFLFKRRNGCGSMIIGSSNLTQAAFTRNVEWNYFTPNEINLPFEDYSPFEILRREFERCFSQEAVPVSEEFLEGYRKRWEKSGSIYTVPYVPEEFSPPPDAMEHGHDWAVPDKIRPNPAQMEAMEALAGLRGKGVQKAAVIAATGVGKTYLAAFDFCAFKGKKLLFIAHRETILQAALDSFRKVLKNNEFGSILGGGREINPGGESVFAMIQTLRREDVLNSFPRDHFDYVVLDEFHHGEALSYRQVIEYFQPRFFLGLTATPERMDGRDVLALCDYQIGYEVRLLEAVDRGWLTPFQYFAIQDETDYGRIPWRGTGYDEAELERALSTDTRTAVVARNLKRFLPATGKIKALAFCSSVNHARYTAKHLSLDFGIPSVTLMSLSTEAERRNAIERLESELDPLEVICSVDIFNEGVDIPNVSHVLFLRPTQSFTIFLQQLGRGLRLSPGKEFLVALDFVGNFRKAYVAPLALAGYTSVESFVEEIQIAAKFDFHPKLPKRCYLSLELEVQRIWDEEIRRIIEGRLTKEDRLRILYSEIQEALGGRSPSLTDFYASGFDVDPMAFIRQFGNWLRAKKFCEGSLPSYEEALLGTAGESFLQHLEGELRPVRSYKMVVLSVILDLPGGDWALKEIAEGFLSHFLMHRDQIWDYQDLSRSRDPERYPLSKVVAKLKQMPLHFLSNTAQDFFILDHGSGRFRIKDELIDFWLDPRFKELVHDRVQFALIRYFGRRKNREKEKKGSRKGEAS
jgi:superfamily II DNA or RNA helicase/predicted house-cleaning noncanonical NTP pyrophosphatase (MazG superfamily)/HKD family nuclease